MATPHPLIRAGALAGLLAGLVACTATGQTERSASQGPAKTPRVTLENPDSLPSAARLVFSRIGAPGSSAIHDQVALRVVNAGAAPLHVSALPISGPWKLDADIRLPLSVPAGGHLDLPLRFVADGPTDQTAADQAVAQSDGMLTVVSDDPSTPRLSVNLAGLWQSAPERDAQNRYSEPSLPQILDTFGYPVTLHAADQSGRPSGKDDGGDVAINQRGAVKAQGGEVISAYWRAAGAGQLVTVQEIAAYEGIYAATLSWYAQGKSDDLTPVTAHADHENQTLLPKQADGQLAAGRFTPAGAFGLNVTITGGAPGDFSDPALNDATKDHKAGCVDPCGQHLRFWPVDGQANTYILAVDRAGINFDYQDNVYLIRNLAPADK